MRTIAEHKKDLRGAHDFVAVEIGTLCRCRDGFGNRVRRRVVAELMSGELAVKCGHMLGSGGIPFSREIGFRLGLGRAPSPIPGARLGIGCVGAGQDVREVVKGE